MAASAAGTGYIGKSILRREDEYLLRGNGRFIDDLSESRDQIHLGFVMSPYAHARIVSIDDGAAKALPGVIDVLTGVDLAKIAKPMCTAIDLPGYVIHERPVLAIDKVRFVGEQVAVVLADSPYVAQDAIDLVHAEYDPLPVAADLETAREPDAPLVHDHIERNIIFRAEFKTEGFDQAFAEGEFVLKETFRTGRVAGVPIEPRGCLAVPDHVGDSLVFYSSTQVPHILRTKLALCIGCPEPRIRVVVPEVGGGFGTKAQIYTEEIVAAALALKYRRPVKWIQDRREELLTSIHSRDHRYDIEAAFGRDGIIKAVRVEVLTNAGAYSSYPFGCTLEPTGGARMLVGPYKIRNYAYKAFAVATHTCPSGAYRGVAQPSCFLTIEGMMDRIGRKLGIDPAEVRLRNIIPTRELPWVNVVGVRYDTGSYEESLRRALEIVGYNAFRKAQAKGHFVGGKYRGIGICNFTEISGAGAPGWRARGVAHLPGFDSALLRVEPTGKITVYMSHANSGQGHLTTFAQIVAEQLGADINDVTVVEGDSALSPYGTNTFASRSAVTGGGAAIRASAKVSEKMKRIAGHLLEASPQDIVLQDGFASVVGVPRMKIPFEEIAKTAYSMNNRGLPHGEDYGIEATDYYDPPLATMANAVHIAQVSVDAEDGRVTVDRYVVVHDCGRIINPVIVNGQIQGGVAQGLGETLMEELVYDSEGQLVNANLLDYLLPTALDVPDCEIGHIESPSTDTVGGFKGVGEGGIIGAVPAIANAVADALSALGVNINRIPLRPSYLSKLIRDAKGSAAAA